MRRRTGLAALFAGVLALTGCGIQQSDVVEAGGPATIAVLPVDDSRFLLFYVDADDRLVPATRALAGPFGEEYQLPDQGVATHPLGSGSVAPKALTLLLEGPSETERAAGLRTRLPQPSAWKNAEAGLHVSLEHDTADGGGEFTLRIRLPFPLDELDGAAIRQLVCTAAYAEESDGRASVILSGPGGALPAERCDDFIVDKPATTTSDVPSVTGRATGTTDSPDTRRDPNATGTGRPGASPAPPAAPRTTPTPTAP
ncbi:hypothetical protein ABZ958_03780 [Streptomyces sp. NPDC046237]|uniref:hypothetical protein n=1 Tax=Streptomyces sp. NPDC046237 TaxID=3154914 RepID=UPI0033C9F740